MYHVTKSKQVSPLALGIALIGSLAAAEGVRAGENPFRATQLPRGYMLADQGGAKEEDKPAGQEGKCGGKADKEAVCGIYQIGSAHDDASKVKDGKCGGHKAVEGVCGGDR